MGLQSIYETPCPDEEADIFGVPGPEWLAQVPDYTSAETEANHLESMGYDDHQDDADEKAFSALAPTTELETRIALLSDDQRVAIVALIREMFEGE